MHKYCIGYRIVISAITRVNSMRNAFFGQWVWFHGNFLNLFSGNHHEVGQYVQIKVIGVSFLEWHPFTLTSAPEDGFFMIHMRVSGNWTGKVYKYFHEIREQNWPLPKIAIEGPFGTSSQDIFGMVLIIFIVAQNESSKKWSLGR